MLIQCPDCNRGVSPQAPTCPGCGRIIASDAELVQRVQRRIDETRREQESDAMTQRMLEPLQRHRTTGIGALGRIVLALVGCGALTVALVSSVRNPNAASVIGLVAVVLVGVAFYMLPTLAAAYRGHPSTGGIVVVNLLLGWTLIGWVVALAWAASGPNRAR